MSAISSLAQFVDATSIRGVAVIAFDVRGTILVAPRDGNLARAYGDHGFNGADLKAVADAAPANVLKSHRDAVQIRDWTLVTVIEAGLMLRDCGQEVSSACVAQAFQFAADEYVFDSKPLLGDDDLCHLGRELHKRGYRYGIVADAPETRERAVLTRLFPKWTNEIDFLFTPESVGFNKLAPEYFLTVADVLDVEPEQMLIVADRGDKDIRSGQSAGCCTLHITASCDCEAMHAASVQLITR